MSERLHVLVIPSEEYIPEHAPLAGIFQFHQIQALKADGNYHIGVLSIRLEYSIPMIIKAILFRMFGRRVGNDLQKYAVGELFSLLWAKLFNPEKFITVENLDDIDVVRIKGFYYFPPSPKTDYFGWIKAGKVAFQKYVEKYGKPDIVHAHNALNAGLLAHELKKRFDVPYILTEHSSYFHQGLVPAKLYAPVSRAIKDASDFLVVSPRLQETLVERLGDVASRATWVPNVLPDYFETRGTALKKEKHSSDAFTFLSVGNLLPVKGHEILVQAFAQICLENIDVTLRIIGDGTLSSELKALVEDLSIKDMVVFLGEVDAVTVMKEMEAVDALVLPSRFETFGVVLIEAMACGLPIVSTACGGPDVIVDETSGILVEPESIEALKDGLDWAIENAQKLDPVKIRESAIERFGAARFCHQMAHIYAKSLCSNQA